MSEEFKPEKVYEDVYVATKTKDNRVILQNRNYEKIAEILVGQVAGLLLDGVCVCQMMVDWSAPESESFWFCQDKNTNKRARADVWEGPDGENQVVMRQPGSSCEE